MNDALLSRPSQLTMEVHKAQLNRFRSEVQKIVDGLGANFSDVALRDWFFVSEEGAPTVRIFLERLGGKIITLQDCLKIHRELLESSAFDDFADSVSIEVGSLGLEPPLRDAPHYIEYVGKPIFLSTWTGAWLKGRNATVVEVKEGSEPEVTVQAGGENHIFALKDVKWAEGLFVEGQPKKAKNQKKQSKKR